MYDNRSAGELNLDAWNDVRGVVRKYDYLDIKEGLMEELRQTMNTKIVTLEQTFLSRCKNMSDIVTLKEKIGNLKKGDVKWLVSSFDLDFPIEDFKIVIQACDTCHAFNGLFNRIKEHGKGVLSTVHITQSELHGMYWLKQNKHKLKELVHQDYKHIIDVAKQSRLEENK